MPKRSLLTTAEAAEYIGVKKSYLEFTFHEAERMKSLGRIGVSKNYANSARQLQKYLATIKKKDVSFRKLSAGLLKDFEDWLHQNGVCRNTSSAYLRCLHTVWNRAVANGLATGDPFQSTYRGVAKTRKRAISMADIRRLADLDVKEALRARFCEQGRKAEGRRFDKQVDRLLLVRDLFVFSFCARGIPFVDMAYLRKSDVRGGSFSYCRHKTGQRLTVHIEPQMQRILDRHPSKTIYLLPILNGGGDAQSTYHSYVSALASYDKSLRQLGDMLGLPITSYVSRHSWASSAQQQNMPMPYISQGLGHDNQRTTEIYLKEIDSAQIDEANRSLLTAVFGTGK